MSKTFPPSAIVAGVVVLLLLAVGCAPPPPAGASAIKPQVGFAAPDFELTDLSNETMRLSSLHGRTVLINFWATWCPPCRAELPTFQRIASEQDDRVVVLMISQGESREAVSAFMQKNGYSFRVLLDAELTVGQAYQATGIPTTVIIDPTGVVRYRKVGVAQPADLEARLGLIARGRAD